MSLIDDVIIDACRLPDLKIVIFTRETHKAKKIRDEVVTALRNYNLDSKYLKLYTDDESTGVSVIFNNGSSVRCASLERMGRNISRMKADQVYFLKTDRVTAQERLQMLFPILTPVENSRLDKNSMLVEV